jgi:hypothetical protein
LVLITLTPIQCGKVFAHPSLLRVHSRKQHLKCNAFPCKFCAKAFNSPGAMLEHLGSIHLKLKPYKCRQCDYFTRHVLPTVTTFKMCYIT